jgi:MFS family permease
VSTTLGQPGFFKFFGLTQDPLDAELYAYTNTIIGAMNACFSGGGFLGSLFVGWACDYLGRKKTLLVATPIAILGGVLQGGAANIAMFLVGRLLGGFATGMYRFQGYFSKCLQFRYLGCPCANLPVRDCPSGHTRILGLSAWYVYFEVML